MTLYHIFYENFKTLFPNFHNNTSRNKHTERSFESRGRPPNSVFANQIFFKTAKFYKKDNINNKHIFLTYSFYSYIIIKMFMKNVLNNKQIFHHRQRSFCYNEFSLFSFDSFEVKNRVTFLSQDFN